VASTYQLFERAGQIEAIAARIYGALAEAFRGDPGARALFARLQTEEEQHASRIRLFGAHYRHDPKLAVEADRRILDACLADATRALAEIEAGAWGRDLDAVRTRLVALEERLSAAHAEVIAKSADPAIRAFFEALAGQDEAHARLLAAAGGRR
jgi:rubrerythrin